MIEQEQLLTVGEILDGKYRVEALIGRGGMGAVYRARHIELDSTRAIKLMRPELARDESFVHRFENEAHLAEGVRHPNVVALYDFAALPDGTKYIVWELVEGETLRDYLERGAAFTSADVVRLVTQIGGGLAAAHQQGIYHRDVSPDNIMICAGSGTERTAKLLDFGVAKAAGTPQSMATTTGMVFGKIGYASPEQMGLLKGEESLDARTDVFSLAAVAYAMLAGEPPFVTSSMRSFLHDLMIAPESEVRARLATVLEEPWRRPLTRALARKREERPSSMEAFVEEIRELVHPHRPPAGATDGPRSNRLRGLTYAGAAILGVVLVAASTLQLGLPNLPPPPNVELETRSVRFIAEELDPWTIPDQDIDDDPPVGEPEKPSREAVPEPERTIVDTNVVPPRDEATDSLEGDLPIRETESDELPPIDEQDEVLEPDGARIEIVDLGGIPEPRADTLPSPTEAVPKAPERLHTEKPRYSELASRLKLEGTVELDIVIAPNGDVTDVIVVKGVHRELDRAAEEAVRQWKYKPGDVSVPVRVEVKFNWTR